MLGCLVSVAAKHDVSVQPLFSYSAYNYVRTYATIAYGARKADNSIGRMGYVLHCFSCFHRENRKGTTALLKLDCPECGSTLQVAGPLWLGSLSNEVFCAKMKEENGRREWRNKTKINQLVSLVIDEASAPATYYVIDKFCDRLNLPIPPFLKVMTELRRCGSEVVPTHFSSNAFRSDASASVVKETITRLARIQSERAQETNIRHHVVDKR